MTKIYFHSQNVSTFHLEFLHWAQPPVNLFINSETLSYFLKIFLRQFRISLGTDQLLQI